jgi:hypothetical protein
VDRVDRRSQVEPAARWAAAGLLLALAVSLVMLLAPNLLETEGWSVVLPLSVPVLMTGGGLIAARRGIRGVLVVSAVLLGAFVALGALSVGIYYLPAEVAMIVAIGKERR